MNPNCPVFPEATERPIEAFRLDGRLAVVIGGTGVLCGAIARAFASAGAHAVLVGSDESKAQHTLSKIEAAGATATFRPCDATDASALLELRERLLTDYGRLDVLVNGAGLNSAKPFLEISTEELDRLLAVNFNAVFHSCQVFGEYFVERAQEEGTGASIINVGSLSGLVPLSRVFAYSAAKAAVHNLSANLAREWAPYGIRVNTLVPGFFPAEQNRRILTQTRRESILAHTPAGRFGEPQELVGPALLLASDAGSFINGAELVVDGGFSKATI